MVEVHSQIFTILFASVRPQLKFDICSVRTREEGESEGARSSINTLLLFPGPDEHLSKFYQYLSKFYRPTDKILAPFLQYSLNVGPVIFIFSRNDYFHDFPCGSHPRGSHHGFPRDYAPGCPLGD